MTAIKRFKPRKGLGKAWIFMVAFGILTLFGLILFLTSGESEFLIIYGIGSIFFILVLISAVSPGASYSIDEQGLFLKKGRSKRLISFKEIKGLSVLSEEQSKEALNRYLAPALQGEVNLDLKQWYKSNRAYGNFIRFCTIPVIQEVTTRGNRRNITGFKHHVPGQFVILKLFSGEEFLLSPEDTKGLFMALSFKTNLSDTSPSSSYIPEVTISGSQKGGFKKFLKIYSIITFVVLLIVVAMVIYFPKPSKEEENRKKQGFTPKAVKEIFLPGWVDENIFRFFVHISMETYLTEREEKEKQLVRGLEDGYRFAFYSGIIGWYQKENELDLTSEEYQELEELVQDILEKASLEEIVRRFNEDYSELTACFEISAPGLKTEIKKTFTGVISRRDE